MSKLIWTEAAREAQLAALEYVAARNMDAALEQLEEIRQQTTRLMRFPNLGRPSRIKGARELSINRTNFLIVYRVVGDNIHIFRFYHTAQKR